MIFLEGETQNAEIQNMEFFKKKGIGKKACTLDDSSSHDNDQQFYVKNLIWGTCIIQ